MKLTVATLILSLLSTLARAKDMDLKTVEQLYLNYNFGQKADAAGVRAAHEDLIRKYSEILPKADATAMTGSDNTASNFLTITQPIPFPTQWSKEKQVLELSERIADRTQVLDRQELLNVLRKAYFNVQLLEKKKVLYVESFAMVERFKRESEQRFAKGFIPRAELYRSNVQYLDLERALLDLDSDLESSRRQLFVSLGQNATRTNLGTDLKIGDAFLKMQEKDLREQLAQHSNETLAISQFKSDSARLQVEAFPYHYLPTVSFKALIPFAQEDTQTTSYTATFSWNIFNGGADRSDQRKTFALREQADYTLRDQVTQFAVRSEKTLNALLAGRASYFKLKEGLTMWEAIVASDHQRFQKGIISSKDLSDDITSYLNYASGVYQQTFELISSLADFSLLVGKEDLFHQLLR